MKFWIKFEWFWLRYCIKTRHDWFDKDKKRFIRIRYIFIISGYPGIMNYSDKELRKGCIRLRKAFRNFGFTVKECTSTFEKMSKAFKKIELIK